MQDTTGKTPSKAAVTWVRTSPCDVVTVTEREPEGEDPVHASRGPVLHDQVDGEAPTVPSAPFTPRPECTRGRRCCSQRRYRAQRDSGQRDGQQAYHRNLLERCMLVR